MEVLPFQRPPVSCVPFVCSAERPEILVGSSGPINSWSYRCPPATGTGESVLAGLPPRLERRGMKEEKGNCSRGLLQSLRSFWNPGILASAALSSFKSSLREIFLAT